MFGTQDTQYRPTFGPSGFEAEAPVTVPEASEASQPQDTAVQETRLVSGTPVLEGDLEGVDPADWHAEAGRKGARRVHELIQEGRLYEQEHGLKSGRQRLRQLIELGKLYEQEHGLRPRREKKNGRLSRGERQQLLSTLLECLVRVAKPSFRADLARLAATLQQHEESPAV